MRILFLSVLTFFVSSLALAQDFYLAANGVTCMCPNAPVGASGDPGNGVVYTKRTAAEITPQNAATTCTSGITLMNNLFSEFSSFNADISTWDVSNVTNMFNMFYGCESFNQDLSFWDVSNVTRMDYMFTHTNFNQDISGWDVSNVTQMDLMFFDTPFNQPIGGWDVSSLESAGSIFGETNFNQDISGWDVSGMLSFSNMFDRAYSFNQDISGWDISNGESFSGMFESATSFNQDISSWDISESPYLYRMFWGASSFDQDLSSWVFHPDVELEFFISNSGISQENYDLLLQSMYAQPLFNKEFGDTGLTYCNIIDHDALITEKGWEFSGGSVLLPTILIPGPIEVETDPGACVATNVDLGPIYPIGCGQLTLSSNAPSEFPLGVTTVTWTIIDGNQNTYSRTQDVEVVMTSDEASVCYVTSDWNSPSKNRIWITSDPSLNGQNVAYHEVFREAPSGVFETIGFINPPEESFLDTSSNNTTQAYRYKVQTVDVCGQELTPSEYHKTILLQSGIATDNSVNLSWNPYVGLEFNTYNIFRSLNGAAYELLASVAASNITYNDTSADVINNFYQYFVSIDVASCSTDPLQPISLRSNQEYVNPNLVIKDNTWLSSAITIYPNPASDYLNISVTDDLELKEVSVYSTLGQRLMISTQDQIDVSTLPSGVYYLSVDTDQGRVNKTLVRE